jgi:predicted  nucleic acid-binding Zn-ribbon protein
MSAVLEVVSQIMMSCVAAFRDTSDKVRSLRARAETAEKKSLELEQKNCAYESQIQALREKLATAQAKVALMTAALLWSMISPRTGLR